MDTVPTQGETATTEAEVARQRRVAWEAARIAEARADVAAGRLVSSAKVKAWIDSNDTAGDVRGLRVFGPGQPRDTV